MPAALERISLQALKLPVESRVRLAELLLQEADEISIKESERLWIAEIKKRYKKYLSGKMKFKPIEDVLQSLSKRLR